MQADRQTIANMATPVLQEHPNQPFALIRNSAGCDTAPDHVGRPLAHTMTLIYNGILRGLNSSYYQSNQVNSSKKSIQAFLQFNQCLCDIINFQLDTVDKGFLFKSVQNDSDTLIVQQEELDDLLYSYKDYIYSTNAEDFDGAKLRGHLDAFAPALRQYAVDGIAWILRQGKALKPLSENLTAGVYRKSSKPLDSDVLQLLLLCLQDATFPVDGHKDVFPDLSWWKRLLIDWTLAREHEEMLCFAPSDCFGNRKTV